MRPLSKSQYTRGLQCAKSLWLYREKPELRAPITPEQQAVFDNGTAFGVLAQKRFPGGVLIDVPHTDPERALLQTAVAINSGSRILYEAAVEFDDVIVRVDVLIKNEAGFHIYEVKSSTEVKDVYLQDVAVQRYVLEGAGLSVSSAHVVIVDNGYVRYGALDLMKLFKVVEVTDETDALMDTVAANLSRMKTMAAAAKAPAVEIGPHCSKPYDCDFEKHCWAHVPDYSVWNLAGARGDKKSALWHDGVKLIEEIPVETKLTAYQATQRAVAKSGKPYIDFAAIRAHLAQLVYPVYGLDFETVAPAIPPHDGLRPYQNLPFQASVHMLPGPAGPLQHFEFLDDGRQDPRPKMIDFLCSTIGKTGSVIAYSKGFEGGVLEKLVHVAGARGPDLLSMTTRLWDVAEPFKKAWYAHPGFRGSWSIKKVLPVCVPGMTYEGMEIAEGTAAMRAYERLMDPATTDEERERIIAGLKAYCGQDTLGMIKLLEHLYAVVA
jgi:hypothetical protein